MSASTTPIPLRIATDVAEELRQVLEPACVRIEVAGSIRRLRPHVHDVELVAIPKIEQVDGEGGLFGPGEKVPWNMLWKTLDGFLEGRRFQAYLKKGDRYRSFFWPIHAAADRPTLPQRIQIDLFTTTVAGWGLIHLIRTGAAGFSKHVLTCLKAQGFICHEGRVYHRVADKPRGDAIATPAEEDVFRLAGMKPVEPAERNWG